MQLLGSKFMPMSGINLILLSTTGTCMRSLSSNVRMHHNKYGTHNIRFRSVATGLSVDNVYARAFGLCDYSRNVAREQQVMDSW